MKNFFKRVKDFLTKESTVTFLKNVAMAGVTMFLVGALLAAAAPLIANGLAGVGLLAAEEAAKLGAASIPWTGAFFGAFGLIQAAVAPVISRIFHPPKPGTTLVLAQASGLEQTVGMPSHSTAQNISPTHFQDLLAAQNAAPSNTPGHSIS